MLKFIFESIWFFLPAGFANMSPVWFKWLPFLNYPVDFGKTLGGKPIFGVNKTWRGLLFGVLVAIGIAYAQRYLQKYIAISIVDYTKISPLVLGLLMGAGALIGDLLKSFFKRRSNIAPGNNWVPFDQLDYIFGAIIFISPYILIPWQNIACAVVLYFIFHPIVNYLGYLLKFKKNKF